MSLSALLLNEHSVVATAENAAVWVFMPVSLCARDVYRLQVAGSILLSHPERVILQPASPPPSLLAVAHPSCPLPQEQLPVELTVSTAASFLGHVANSVTALGMCHHSQGAPRSRGCPSLKLKLSGQLPFKSLSRL